MVPRGQRGPGVAGGEGKPVMRPWRNPGVGVTRSGAKELKVDPEVEAEPVRSLDGAQVRRAAEFRWRRRDSVRGQGAQR